MNKFIQENWFKAGILLIIFFIGLSVSYYYLFLLPAHQKDIWQKKEAWRQEAIQKQEEIRIEKEISSCREKVVKVMMDQLESVCRNNFELKKKEFDECINLTEVVLGDMANSKNMAYLNCSKKLGVPTFDPKCSVFEEQAKILNKTSEELMGNCPKAPVNNNPNFIHQKSW